MGKKESVSIKYDAHVDSDLDALDSFWQRVVLDAIENKLMVEPILFGTPLRQNLRGFRKLRVGDYRVIYQVVHQTVFILIIGHRSVVYPRAERRL